MSNTINVAIDASKGLAVQAKGDPAKIVAFGAAAGLVFISVGIGYGAYEGTRAIARRLSGRSKPSELDGSGASEKSDWALNESPKP